MGTKKHFVYFDGTSAWIDGPGLEDNDTSILLEAEDFESACKYCDDYNDRINNQK